MQLRWKVSFSVSCLHAAACMHEGLPIADASIAATLQPAVRALVDELTASNLQVDTALPQLVELAAEFENNRQLIEMLGKRILGVGMLSEAKISRLAGCVTGLEAAWLRKQPGLVEELAVRGRPLREQWEARGPGLLHAIAKLSDKNIIAPSAEVVLVSPLVGGHGRSHLKSNRVTFEAVLTHPNPELSETLRLGWLLSQLNLDLPMLGESVSSRRLPTLASLAMLPLVLAAAEVVELATLDLATLTRAIDVWYVPTTSSKTTAQKLLDWWQAYSNSNTRWLVALAALDQIFCE